MPSPRSELRTRRAAACLVAALCVLPLVGCDQLGNPPRRFRTPETTTSVGPFRLRTRSETVPAAHATELLRRIAGRPHFLDENAPEYVTLVVVDVEPRGATLPHYVSLATDLSFAEGPPVRRPWLAPGSARPFVAVFATRAPPTDVRTGRGP